MTVRYPDTTNLFSLSDDFHSALELLSALTVEDQHQNLFTTPQDLDGDLVTLTLLPRSRWQTLLNLEVIQVISIAIHVLYRLLIIGIHIISNETNQKSHRNPQNRLPFSCRPSQASNTDSKYSRRIQKPIKVFEGSRRPQQNPRASSSSDSRMLTRTVIVSIALSPLDLGVLITVCSRRSFFQLCKVPFSSSRRSRTSISCLPRLATGIPPCTQPTAAFAS